MNRVLRVFAFTILFSQFLFSNTIFAEIIIRANKDAFPANYIGDKGWQGMDIDVIKEIFLRAKLNYRIIDRSFKRSLVQMKSGEVHLMSNLSKNEERSAYMYWLGPTRITCIGLVVLKKDQHLPIKTCDDIIKVAQQKNKKFGYLNGASYSKYFDNRLKNDPALTKALLFLHDNKLHHRMLRAGRILGYFYDAFEIRHRILDQRFAQEYDGMALHPYKIEESCSGAYFGISKKLDKNKYEKIMGAFQSMKDDGTFAKIHLDWVGSKPTF